MLISCFCITDGCFCGTNESWYVGGWLLRYPMWFWCCISGGLKYIFCSLLLLWNLDAVAIPFFDSTVLSHLLQSFFPPCWNGSDVDGIQDSVMRPTSTPCSCLKGDAGAPQHVLMWLCHDTLPGWRKGDGNFTSPPCATSYCVRLHFHLFVTLFPPWAASQPCRKQWSQIRHLFKEHTHKNRWTEGLKCGCITSSLVCL